MQAAAHLQPTDRPAPADHTLGEGSAFGLQVICSAGLPGLDGTAAEDRPRVSIEPSSPGEVRKAWSGPGDQATGELSLDGVPFHVRTGAAGDLLLEYGARACFHVDAERTLVRYGAACPDGLDWQRVLLDTVLWLVALDHGHEALHAAAVSIRGRLVAIAGGQGGGKTTLAAELLRRGGTLFSDDILCCDARGLCHPGPALMNVSADDVVALPGRVLGRIGPELWVRTPRVPPQPAPLAAVVVLHRRAGYATRLVPAASAVREVLPHLVVHRTSVDRSRSRFELCADLVARTPVVRLEADPAVPPAELGDQVERFLRTSGDTT